MSVVLVVEQDTGYANRIAGSLRAAGFAVNVVGSREAAIQSSMAQPPSIVLVSGTIPGAAQLLGQFSKRRQGPGSVALLPVTLATQANAADYQADEILAKPFSDEDLHGLLRNHLAPRPSSMAPQARPGQLTSAEIFGDVLAEVEAEAQRAENERKRQPAQQDHADIDRKLEETLSGVLPPARPKRKTSVTGGLSPELQSLSNLGAAQEAPRRISPPTTAEIDDLLDKTLSSLELPTRSRRSETSAPKPGAPKPGAPKPGAPKPGAPKPAPAAPTFAAPPPEPEVPADAQASQPTTATPTVASPQPPSPSPSFSPPLADPTTFDPIDDTTSLEIPVLRPATEPTPEPSPIPSSPTTPPPTATPPFAEPEPFPPDTGGWAVTSFEHEPGDSISEPAVPQTADFSAPAPTPESLTPPPADAFTAPTSFDSDAPSTFVPTDFSAPSASSESPAISPPDFANEAPLLEPPASFGDSPALSFGGTDPISFDQPYQPPKSFDAPLEPPSLEPPSLEPPSLELPAFEPPAFEPPSLEPPAFEPPNPASSLTLPPTEAPTVDVSSFASQAVEELPATTAQEGPATESSASTGTHAATSFEDSAFEDTSAATLDPPSDFASPAPFPPAKELTLAGVVPSESTDHGQGLEQALEGVLQIRGDDTSGGGPEDGIRFGDYRLLDRVAVGGMAEVWRARRRGVEGFQKTVAIKKILSHLTGSLDFVTMFIDEAKLAAQLSHNNIIQIYDLGKVDDDFFIAMEFVEGKDLRSILTEAIEQKRPIPMGLGLVIVAALARALDYAHRKKDFDHRDMGLVHRDVSPQNVLISYEGEIKLCDFGIVKAVAKASTTQMGALKGKLQYMSPEQAWGREVDARSDIFSLGSVLFEVLTRERLFTGDSEIGVLDAVRDCRIRSVREIEPDIPEEVDNIIQKALAKTPETRYSTAGEMEADIKDVLERIKPTPSQTDLAAYLDELFKSPADSPSAAPLASSINLEPPAQLRDAGSSVIVPPEQQAAAAPTQKKSALPKIFIALIILAALAAAVLFWLKGQANAPQTQQAPPPTSPAATQPAITEPAATEPATSSEPATPGVPSGTDPAAPAEQPSEPGDEAAAGGPEGSEIDLEGLIGEELANAREQLQREHDEERRQLEAEIARTRAKADSSPDGDSPDGN